MVLLVDGANVVGARPDGWWRDRPAAAARLCRQLREAVGAGRVEPPVTVVLEGAARDGEPAGTSCGVRVVHATGSGDDTLAALCGPGVVLVSADRGLGDRARQAGATVGGPAALLRSLRTG